MAWNICFECEKDEDRGGCCTQPPTIIIAINLRLTAVKEYHPPLHLNNTAHSLCVGEWESSTLHVCIRSCVWYRLTHLSARCVLATADVFQLFLPSDSDVTGGGGALLCSAGNFCLCSYLSIHPPFLSIHPSIACLPAATLLAEHGNTISRHWPFTPLTRKGPREKHGDEFSPPVGPNPSAAAPHRRQNRAAHTQSGCPF